MKEEVWKFDLALRADPIELQMPRGAQVLHVGEQQRFIRLWALVVPDAPKEARTFFVKGTGTPVEPKLDYVGTVMMFDAMYVWHIFERRHG